MTASSTTLLPSGAPSSSASDAMCRLTARERDVLALVADGHSNAGIANLLDLTIRTVETHTSRIFAKLDLDARASDAVHRRVLATRLHLQVSTEHPDPDAPDVAATGTRH